LQISFNCELKMTEIALSVEKLSKTFQIAHERNGKHRRLHDELFSLPGRLVARLAGKRRPTYETFWALKDISFEVKQGEVVGIIGRNGAGKSTLLKVLNRITEPTSGLANIYGRVGGLLEVGTGFHPELTGRENIFMNGAILGMTRAEIRRKFDEIVAFAEIQKFLDTPVKRYSSGMYVRLAFAIAAHLDPEIILIDEVLSVGDAQFQNKCLGKMEDVARKEGRTALFVSHNLGAVAQLCTTTIWIDNGVIRRAGPSSQVIADYMTTDAQRGEVVWPEGRSGRGVTELKLYSARVRNSQGSISSTVESTKPFSVEIEYEITKPLWNLRVGFFLRTSAGGYLFDSHDADGPEFRSSRDPGHYTACCYIPGNLLGPGTYLISLNAGIHNVASFAREENTLVLEVVNTSTRGTISPRGGVIQPQFTWKQKTHDVREVAVGQ
jgi:lipopolysaccharide transport system ATP-binding protein